VRRFSIRTLMAVILVSAVGLAALRNANELWAGIMLLAVLIIVGMAILGAILLRGRDRAWWLGFALFAGGYLALAFTSLAAPVVMPKLATTHLLEYMYSRATNSTGSRPSFEQLQIVRLEGLLAEQKYMKKLILNPNDLSLKLIQNKVNELSQRIGLPVNSTVSPDRTNAWQAILPGAATYEDFERVSHALFALLFGLLGGLIAGWIYTRRDRAEASSGRGAQSHTLQRDHIYPSTGSLVLDTEQI
jgi:hypothetical protein